MHAILDYAETVQDLVSEGNLQQDSADKKLREKLDQLGPKITEVCVLVAKEI